VSDRNHLKRAKFGPDSHALHGHNRNAAHPVNSILTFFQAAERRMPFFESLDAIFDLAADQVDTEGLAA
jgi:hypothetical protein